MMLNKDSFIKFIRTNYSLELQSILKESHSGYNTFLDVDLLNKKLKSLCSFEEALNENDWFEIAFDLCPEVYDDLDFGPLSA